MFRCLKFAGVIRSLLGRHTITLLVGCITLLTFTTLRIALLIRHVSFNEISTPDLLRVMFVGFRFDLLTAAVFVLPLGAHLTLIGDRWISSRPSRLMLESLWIVGFLLLPFSCIVEFTFFEEFESRLNYIAFEYLVYPTEVCCNIWQSYPVIPLFSTVAMCGIGFYAWVRRPLLACLPIPLSPLRRYSCFAALLAALPALWLTLSWSSTQISDNRVANESAGNGWYSFVYYAWSCRVDYEDFYPTLDQDEATERTRRRIVAKSDHPEKESANPVDRVVASSRSRRDLNVVIVLEESFGSDFVGVLGDNRGLTPRFDALSKEGILFDNFYATGNRTARALEAVLTSLLPLPTESILKRDHSEHVYTLANVLADRGYERLFITAGRGLFDGVRRFMKSNGFNRFLEQSDFVDPVFVNAWGVCDEDLFHRAIEELDALHAEGKPFFATLLTVSNHRPYTYPEGRIKASPHDQQRDNAVSYADWALGDFFDKARSHAFFKDTIFIVLGDHGARIYGRQMFPMKSYRVPVLVLMPDGEGRGTRVSTLASTIDIAPTVMGLLGGEYRSVFFGHDILTTDPAHAFAVMQHNHDVAVLDAKNKLVVLGSNKSAWGYLLDRKTYELTATGFPEPEAAQDTVSLYQTANRLYYGRQCYPAESSEHRAVAKLPASSETRTQ